FLSIAKAETSQGVEKASLVSKENVVDAATGGGPWISATLGQFLVIHDRLRTGEDSRAAVRMTDLSVLRVDELTTVEIVPPPTATDKAGLNVKEGTTYFLTRQNSRETHFQKQTANAQSDAHQN